MAQPPAARAIEAILMVAQEPVDPHLLAQLLEVSPVIVEELCQQLKAAYEADDRGFVLVKVAGGYRFQSHADLAPYVERFVLEGQSARLSSAALETLAIVAYKQPISRAQIASVRGVNVDGVMRTLQQRGYVLEVGRDPGPGQATLFGTSQEFLERLGLDTLADLPPIADLFPSTDIMEALERGLRADRPGQLPLDEPTVGTDGVAADERASEPDGGGAAVEATAPPGGIDEPARPLHVAREALAGGPDGDDREPDDDDDLAPPAWALDDPTVEPADAPATDAVEADPFAGDAAVADPIGDAAAGLADDGATEGADDGRPPPPA